MIRRPLSICAFLSAVAACSNPGPFANGANATAALRGSPSQTAPGPVEASPGNANAAPASSVLAPIPAALRGAWGLTPRDCTSSFGDAKGLLVVTANELRFYESRAIPAPGVQTDAHSISGEFRFTGEGQSWTKDESIVLQQGRLVRTETSPAASFIYAPCD